MFGKGYLYSQGTLHCKLFMPLLLDYPHPGVSLLTLNRPQAANALNATLGEALVAALGGFSTGIRAVVLTGAGGRAFCAGADLKERQGMDEAAWEAQHKALRAARNAVLACPAPVIAAVNGAAYGGGLELALSCDFIYAAEDARFALTEARLGIMPGLGGVTLLSQAVGTRKALEMLYTGESLEAGEALAAGLVNRVFAPETLLPETLALAQRIAENAPLSVKAIKRSARAKGLAEALAAEWAEYRALIPTSDRVEGISAFNEKRKAKFTGA